MQIQVMNRSGSNDASDVIGVVLARLNETSNGYVQADAYAVDGLLGILDVRAARGEREILVIGCSRDQIRAVLEWQSCTDGDEELEDLVLHLVRYETTERTVD
jgi:hypothetical protein